jgi:hypothetical protein
MPSSFPVFFEQGHALLIGIQYHNWGSGKLPCTLNDVKEIAQTLIDKQKAAYPQNQVKQLLEQEATASGILDALDDLAKRVHSDSTVIIYYSGHGGVKEGKYFFVPYDYSLPFSPEGGTLWDEAVLVSAEEFTQKVKIIREKAKKVLVVLDCCHAAGSSPLKSEPSGHLFLSGIKDQLSQISGFPKTKSPDVSALQQGEGMVVLTSSKPEETSLAGRHLSLFTQALIEVLSGQSKSSSDDGWVYIEDVKRYLDTHVPHRASQNNRHSQNPVTDMNGVSGHFIVCAYDISKAKNGISDSLKREKPAEVPPANKSLDELVTLIETDMRAAFQELDKISWGNSIGLYNDLKSEFMNQPVGFNRSIFRDRLVVLAETKLK